MSRRHAINNTTLVEKNEKKYTSVVSSTTKDFDPDSALQTACV